MRDISYNKWSLLLPLVLVAAVPALAQVDSLARQKPVFIADSSRSIRAKTTSMELGKPGHRKPEYFRDTFRRERRKFDSSLFTTITVPSTSDYAEDLGKIYEMLSQVPAVTESFIRLDEISDDLDQGDSALNILKERMSVSDRSLNIRNLQMFNTLLDAMSKHTHDYSRLLDRYDTALDGVRKQIDGLRKDTLMLHIFRDTVLKNQFQPQLLQLKAKWRLVDSLVTENGKEINTLKSQVSAHAITIDELTYRVDGELKAVGNRAFGKERRYLWEPRTSVSKYSKESFQKSVDSEQQLARYYFSNTRSKRFWLIATGIIFFFWIWYNFRSLRRLDKLKAIDTLHLKYINAYPVGGALVFILSLAPLFDLHAPAIYIESVQFLLMLLLTLVFRKRLPRNLFYAWCLFLVLFMLLPVTRILGLPLSLQRWLNLLVDSASFAFAIFFLLRRKRMTGLVIGNPARSGGASVQSLPSGMVTGQSRWITFAACLYLLLNLLAILCNLFGRVTLSQIFGATAVYSFAQTVSLGVFVQLVLESFLLQIQSSRIRKKYPEGFDYRAISRSIRRVSMALAIVLWLIVVTTNLNIFDALNDILIDLFTNTQQVGNFSFTLGGILLFLGIIWFANFLQKYIAYFFGDTGDDASIDDKGQRSRLLVTRLILLTGGFLLAVAASGLAVDRITVILGALGVGIGLGLQGIVNNFVSGIILIFDRPVRIGDTVEVGDKKGRVKEIGIRSSTLLTEEGAEVIIPNGDILSNHIVNWTLSNNHVRVVLSFTIAKPANPEDVGENEIKDIVRKVHNVLEQREPEVMLNTVSSKAFELKVYFWVNDITQTSRTSAEIRTEVYHYLDKKGIVVN
ncbi:MAG TPA: mechanosensitive ion channel domain-containing protein [Puia sp.]|nr:mechanosensitive ion channel domain-containing protein [Puia sp.]